MQIAGYLNNLGNLHQLQGQLDKSEPLLKESLSMLKHIYGEDHPKVALGTWNLAVLLRKQNKIEEAKIAWEDALQKYQQSLGIEHPQVQRCLEWWDADE